MTQLNQSTRLTSDDRYELASMAQNQQRANNPKHFIILGFVVVVISLLVLIFAWQAKSNAENKLLEKDAQLARIRQIMSEIEVQQLAQSADTDLSVNDNIPDLYSRMERYAKQAQLERDIGLPKASNQPMGNAKRIIYPYSVRDPSLTKLLDWVTISLDQIPGMNIQEISLTPESSNWLLKITFVRYERNE